MATEQRFVFDEVAALYDRHRPRYPDVLFDDLVKLAAIRPQSRVLEIGCGTGQATIPLVRRGFDLLCLEPGASMAALARRNLAGTTAVEIREQTFEAWPVEPGAFGLVVCAQSFHWLPPEIRFAKVAAALNAAGSLAVIGNVAVKKQTVLQGKLDVAYANQAPSLTGPPASRFYPREADAPELFAASGCFGKVTTRSYPSSKTYTPEEYCDLLRTHSDHRLLPRPQRNLLLDAVSTAIREEGGCIEVSIVSNLFLAQKLA